uniref:Uncharacterized protein n=1 Tax=Arundo donax TaxID=35708 RepID=A0A0A8Z940_ARUDO
MTRKTYCLILSQESNNYRMICKEKTTRHLSSTHMNSTT